MFIGRKQLYIIEKKLIISNSNTMQPLLDASKAWQTIPTDSLKKRENIKKYRKQKLSLVTEVDEPKTNSLIKPRRWNNLIVKFQNLKHK